MATYIKPVLFRNKSPAVIFDIFYGGTGLYNGSIRNGTQLINCRIDLKVDEADPEKPCELLVEHSGFRFSSSGEATRREKTYRLSELNALSTTGVDRLIDDIVRSLERDHLMLIQQQIEFHFSLKRRPLPVQFDMNADASELTVRIGAKTQLQVRFKLYQFGKIQIVFEQAIDG